MISHAPLPDVLKEEMDIVQSKLDNAIKDAQDGKDIDLSGLQSRASILCNSILELPARHAKNFQPDIADVIRKLDSLEKALQERIKNA